MAAESITSQARVDDWGTDFHAGASWRQRSPYLVFAGACYLISPYLGLTSNNVDPRIAELWPPGGVGFVLLTVVWSSGRTALATTVAAMALVFTVTALALGLHWSESLWWAVTAAAQPLLMAALYRRWLGRPGWVPERPHDLAALLWSAAGSSLAIGLIGGYPFLDPGDIWSRVLVWWVLRNTVFCFVGAATFMVIFYRRTADVLPATPPANWVPLVVVSAGCVYGAYQPDLPLSWLLIVPSVWAGLTLTMRGAAYLSLTVALLAAAATYLPDVPFGYGALLPAASMVDLLVTASTAFTLLLTLMRVQRASLIVELDRKGAESEERRQVLETVFESMSDGVMIANQDGVSLYNASARTLLGRQIPDDPGASWVDRFSLTGVDGTVLTDADIREAMFTPGGQPKLASLELRVGHGSEARIIEVTVQPLGENAGESTVVLLHDATQERARLRELADFAGTVAHDLRGPLTVLDGWIELISEEPSPQRRAAALDRARDASRRLRQVVDDWLAYAVVRNGQLTPVPVGLEKVAEEVVESHRTAIVEGDRPDIQLDLEHAVRADEAMLRQVFDNLLGNAIKYTPTGIAPVIRVVSRRDSEPGWILVEVSDQGIGVPEGEEELIFEEFHRGSQPGRSAGTGLGLAMTRRIVARHGGQLSARRNPAGGSTFSFTLPEA